MRKSLLILSDIVIAISLLLLKTAEVAAQLPEEEYFRTLSADLSLSKCDVTEEKSDHFLNTETLSEDGFVIKEDFEAELTGTTTEGAEVKSGYDFHGVNTQLLCITDGGSYTLPVVSSTDSIIELSFDLFPKNMSDGDIFKLCGVPILAFHNTALQLLNKTAAAQMNLDWYKIMLIISQNRIQIFINNCQASEPLSLSETVDVKNLMISFHAGSSAEIYVDSIMIAGISGRESTIIRTDYIRYGCHIHHLVPGEIEAGITVYNYSNGELNGKMIMTLYRRTDKSEVLIGFSMSETVRISAGRCQSVVQKINVPESTKGCYLKTYFWETEKMVPYIEENAALMGYRDNSQIQRD